MVGEEGRGEGDDQIQRLKSRDEGGRGGDKTCLIRKGGKRKRGRERERGKGGRCQVRDGRAQSALESTSLARRRKNELGVARVYI